MYGEVSQIPTEAKLSEIKRQALASIGTVLTSLQVGIVEIKSSKIIFYKKRDNFEEAYGKTSQKAANTLGFFRRPEMHVALTTYQTGSFIDTSTEIPRTFYDVLRTTIHEGLHGEAFFKTVRNYRDEDGTDWERSGYRITSYASKTAYFSSLDERAVEDGVDYALSEKSRSINFRIRRNGQHNPRDRDELINLIKAKLAQHSGLSEEEVHIQTLRGMLSEDASYMLAINDIFGKDAVMKLGLHGITDDWVSPYRDGYIQEYFVEKSEQRKAYLVQTVLDRLTAKQREEARKLGDVAQILFTPLPEDE